MKILITGGAGFIGSNIVEALLKKKNVSLVRVLDNLSTGFISNIEPFLAHPKLEFVKGDIQEYDTCVKACKGIDCLSHQAALVSVPKSIQDPLSNNAININGTLNLLSSAKEAGVQRIVFATSAAVYGDSQTLPKVEEDLGKLLSPYALAKYVNELYASIYSDLYGLEFIGLRYFNVFGQRQDPSSAYASVIPIFIKKALYNDAPTINGDGSFSRDFVHVQDVVQANLLGLFTQEEKAINKIYNIGRGEQTTLNQLWQYIKAISDCSVNAIHGEARIGDIPHSLADISKAQSLLDFHPKVSIKEGLEQTMDYYQQTISKKRVIAV